jgi:Protein of unknown function (DUF2867)
MNTRPVESAVPPDSRAAALLGGASFSDCWRVRSTQLDKSALELFLAAAASTPRWVNWAMGARNRVVQLFGLKHLGHLDDFNPHRAPGSYMPGERVGIFTLFEQSFDEVLLGDKDKHLDVVLSVHRALAPDRASIQVSLSTIVHVKNLLGRVYMLPVTPAHRIIAPAVLGRIAARPGAV